MKKIISLLLLSTSVYAQPDVTPISIDMMCGTGDVRKNLYETYGEMAFIQGNAIVRSMNVQMDGEAVIYVNPETMSWTFVLKQADKQCIVSSGENIQPAKEPEKEEEGVLM